MKIVPILACFLLITTGASAADRVKVETPLKQQTVPDDHVAVWVKLHDAVKQVRILVTITDSKGTVHDIFKLTSEKWNEPIGRWAGIADLVEGENKITVFEVKEDGTDGDSDETVVRSVVYTDERAGFEATGYIGASIDSFSAKPVRAVLGYNSTDTGPKTGWVGGIDFAYRVFGARRGLQLWAYGETIHGQRSAEVQCDKSIAEDQRSPLCRQINPVNFGDQFFAVLRNASSLEAYTGVRLELFRVNRSTNSAASVYLKSELGLITMQENGGDAIDDHTKIAAGLILTNGPFQGSYLDTGLGRTDLFSEHRGRRFKVDGYVQWRMFENNKKVNWIAPFFQFVTNTDFGPGSDDIRSYYGINFDLRQLGCKIAGKTCE